MQTLFCLEFGPTSGLESCSHSWVPYHYTEELLFAIFHHGLQFLSLWTENLSSYLETIIATITLNTDNIIILVIIITLFEPLINLITND